jgi:hypothetical protein
MTAIFRALRQLSIATGTHRLSAVSGRLKGGWLGKPDGMERAVAIVRLLTVRARNGEVPEKGKTQRQTFRSALREEFAFAG